MANIIKGINGIVAAVIDEDSGAVIAHQGGSYWEGTPSQIDTFVDFNETLKVGDAYDHKEVRFDGFQKAIMTTLFSLINDVRTLKSQPTITAAQFKTYVKNLM